jgi:hypothetical protein
MPTLWFVVPVHGRAGLATICLRQLQRTCEALGEDGIEASAVVIGDRSNLLELRQRTPGLLGAPWVRERATFAAIERDNRYLSRKFNDGIQLACDSRYNSRPADFVVPIGSDDWVDHRILLQLPERNRMVVGFQRMSFVREDGRVISSSLVNYEGGCGIRIYPRWLLSTLGYRPADEDRSRGCDTSILVNLRRTVKDLEIAHRDVHVRQIVDFKSHGEQLNAYDELLRWKRSVETDPWAELAETYPGEAIDEMQDHYSRSRERELEPA